MARSSSLKVGPTTQPKEKDFLRVPETPLAFEDRTALRAMFASPVFKRAWHNASLSKPSCLAGNPMLHTERGPSLAINQIHLQQGWEMFSAALLRQVEDPKPAKTAALEKYSDAGREILDPNKLPPARLASPAPNPKP